MNLNEYNTWVRQQRSVIFIFGFTCGVVFSVFYALVMRWLSH